MILVLGALLGLTSVILGAYLGHGSSLPEQDLSAVMTALRYHQLHAVMISVVGLALLGNNQLAKNLWLKWSGLLFVIGTVLFSFSIYLSVSLSWPALRTVTPFGGVSLIAAWGCLLIAGLSSYLQQR
ncbi:MAG: DUF423 domain-containing protein [Gammaproteobacteria bacterium]